MASLRSCLRDVADWGFNPNYVVREYMKWVSVAFYVFLKRERFVPDWRAKGLWSSHVDEYLFSVVASVEMRIMLATLSVASIP